MSSGRAKSEDRRGRTCKQVRNSHRPPFEQQSHLIVTCLIASLLIGCRAQPSWRETILNETSQMEVIERKVNHPRVEIYEAALTSAPVTLRDREQLDSIKYRDVSIPDVLAMAMQNSTVLRDLGGVMLRTPDAVNTNYTQGMRITDPRYSPEAALSAFDAQLSATAYFNNRDQTFNNPFFAGGTNTFQQDLNDYTAELSKRSVTGARMALRGVSNYDANNAPSNTYRSAWDSYVEGELRQPLLQGGGVEFNRIAGQGATPGVYNGFLIAKVNNEISQTEFEIAVRDYVSNVVNCYWDLYFAYRDLDARTHAMERSLEAWNRLQARSENDMESAARAALAREQYFRFKADVDDAVSGRVIQGTQNRNGSTGGTLRATSGVQVAERRLRLMVGLPINDDELLRPSEEPSEADVQFHWDAVMHEALSQRPELRRQQLNIQKRQMELLAARNFLNPRLDTVGRYRFRGFGDDLINHGSQTSSIGDLVDGDLQEWYLGVEYTVPLGYRKGHLAMSNAELALARERALQLEQEREVVHDLSNAVSDAARAYENCQTCWNRLVAAHEVLTSYEVQEENGREVDIDRLLDAQRRVVESEIRYFQSRTEYALALKNVHVEKGSLMAENGLYFFDGPAPAEVARIQ